MDTINIIDTIIFMIIKVRVHTNSKSQKILKGNNEIFEIYTNQRPVEGKANEEIIKMVAEYFGIKTNQVFIESGKKSKEKTIEIMSDLK